MDQGKMDKKIIKYIVLIAVMVLAVLRFDTVLGFVGNLWSIATPLVLGAVMAYVLNIIMKKLEQFFFPKSKQKFVTAIRRPVCIVLSILLIVLVVFLIIRLVVPELVETIRLIGKWIPFGLQKGQEFLLENSDQIPELEKWIASFEFDWESTVQKVIQYLTTGVGGLLGSTLTLVGTIGGGVTNFVIGLIFAIYILASKEKLQNQISRTAKAYAKPELLKKAEKVLKVADETFSSFIVGQCTEAVILGVLCIIGMKIFGFDYAPMVGTFIGATALIPVVGAYIGGAVGFIMILTVSPVKAAFFLLFLVVLQQLEGNIIYPRVVGSSIGLPGMWVLASVTVGAGLGGIIGMLLGVPLAATAYKLLRSDVHQRVDKEVKNKIEKKTDAKVK
ncbi:MAG: AI-2E family transporter [Lachnospiraceae bacterium]|nr:AI-2E family transporter [Lachnospiraceae bacterium]